MAGPGLGPRTESSQISFWTQGAHSSQRDTGDMGLVTTQRGPPGAQGTVAALVLERGLGGEQGHLTGGSV